VGISYDSVEILKKFSERNKVTFPILSDPGSKTIKEYGLHFQRGLPHPGTVLIDQKGVIRAKLFEDGFRKRHTPEELILEAKKLQKEKAKK
jgi:peroxiredoxin